jgi:hypothetical protein
MMRLGALLLTVMLVSPAAAQDEPEITPDETAASTAAVEAANLSDDVYRDLWCAGLFSQRYSTQVAAAEPGAAQQSADARDALYRKAAVGLLATGMTEPQFTAIAENVYRVVLSQTRVGTTARDFTDEACEAAKAP